ncbi:glutathione synthetase-like isoform X1 [Paramuricea clavata]|nr:glutathione synthetase-like isoform X1 [Paramuricea clavata]
MVVQSGEKNRVDQRVLEYSIRQSNPAVKVIRRTLQEIEENGELKDDKKLVIDGKEIAVAYFRAGYTPKDYYSEKDWSARLKLERSRAIKCPTIAYQLVGTKKIQQVLAEPGVVERFLDDPEMVARIRKTFAGLFSLDNGEEGNKNAKMAIENPDRFVVKPQREGGGNNIYGEEIRDVLSKEDNSRTQYVLMEKIRPPVLKNYIVQVHKDEILEEDVVCEYGVFGVVISDGDEIVENKVVGHLLRTKSIIHDDGGVAALRAVLDSPCLV